MHEQHLRHDGVHGACFGGCHAEKETHRGGVVFLRHVAVHVRGRQAGQLICMSHQRTQSRPHELLAACCLRLSRSAKQGMHGETRMAKGALYG